MFKNVMNEKASNQVHSETRYTTGDKATVVDYGCNNLRATNVILA